MWSKLSIISYLASLTSLLMVLFNFHPFNWSYSFLLYFGVFAIGLFGFVFSILSTFFDASKKHKKNKIQTFIFYLGMITVFFGLFSLMQKLSFTYLLFAVGLIIMAFSFFIRRKESEVDEDLLDS